MPAKDNTALAALIAFVAATVICGALALYFWHTVSAEEGGLETQLKDAQSALGDVEKETADILEKVRRKKTELGALKRVHFVYQDDLRRAEIDQK